MEKKSSFSKRKFKIQFDRLRNENDQEALRQIFAIYFPRLNNFACKVIKDEIISQDIVQDVFVKFWETRQSITNINIEGYLFRMVKNKCLDYIRHLKIVENNHFDYSNTAKYEELYRIDFIGDEPYILIEKELLEEIDNVISSLPEKCKEVFILSRVKGLKNKEIAEKLNINIKNVERHITKALNTFKSKLADKIPLALIILVIRNL